MLNDDVLYSSVRELSERIRSRRLSPVDLTESYLERSRRMGPRLNAYAHLTRELALRQARQAEQEINSGKYRGPLHGIPYAAKDLLAVRGYPTEWGARPYAGQQFDYDATVISRLTEAGAILIGKAAMIELAGGMGYRFASASITGAAKNPWNLDCWTCGSSSGSAAIVAAALAGFAIGTETWGSIVCPSAFTGISGLRPTYGRVSRHGAMALSYSMDKIGPMARAAEDCALILSVIAGHDPQDPASLPEGQAEFRINAISSETKSSEAGTHSSSASESRVSESRVSESSARESSETRKRRDHRSSSSGLRIGWLTNAWKEVPKSIAAATSQVRDVLTAQNASVMDAHLPEGPWETAAGIVISVEGAAAFESLISSGKVSELTDPLGKIGGYVNQEIPAADFIRAMRVRRVLQEKMNRLFADFDVLATASLPVTASTLDTNLETGLSFPDPAGGIGNLCGLPAVSVPCGFDEKNLPIAVQFLAQPLNDHLALTAARLYQDKTDWHKRRPPLTES